MCTAAFLVHLWDVFSSLEQRPCDLHQHAGSLARLLRSLTFRFTGSAEHFSETESQKYPDVALRRSADEAVLGWIYGQRFDRWVVGLEALALVLVGEVQ